MCRTQLILITALFIGFEAKAEEICDLIKGSTLISQDEKNTYLGKIVNQYDSKSIFNEYGSYGNEYSPESIWNTYSSHGSDFSSYSANNPYAASPPMIVKSGKILGYLSANKRIDSSVSPNILKALCKEDM